MFISRLLLQHFRSYETADFTFTDGVNFIIGPNTAGKSNLIEAIYLLSSGRSFRAEKDNQLLKFHAQVSHVKGKVVEDASSGSGLIGIGRSEPEILEVILSDGSIVGSSVFSKKFSLNGVSKRRVDFAGTLRALLFDPSDLDIISGSPSLRREFLDEILEQTDKEYRRAVLTYVKALRHRNALLHHTRETDPRFGALSRGSSGAMEIRQGKQFSYWDDLLITTGKIIHEKRAAFIAYINSQPKDLFVFSLVYDHSIISEERLFQYREAELSSGVTLVGPHRDDLQVMMHGEDEEIAVKSYASRGQQRLVVVQLKLLQLQYMREHNQIQYGTRQASAQPVLLLDDIFSELDNYHIQHVLNVVKKQQTIITTTHKEFIEHIAPTDANVIELGQ